MHVQEDLPSADDWNQQGLETRLSGPAVYLSTTYAANVTLTVHVGDVPLITRKAAAQGVSEGNGCLGPSGH